MFLSSKIQGFKLNKNGGKDFIFNLKLNFCVKKWQRVLMFARVEILFPNIEEPVLADLFESKIILTFKGKIIDLLKTSQKVQTGI
jgi:hypothetical protein